MSATWRRDVGALSLAWMLYAASAVVWCLTASSLPRAIAGVVPQGMLLVCGTIIVLRADERRIGWLLLWPGAVILFAYPLGLTSPEALGGQTLDIPHRQSLLALANLVLWPLLHIVVVFPSGKLRTTPERWLAVVLGFVMVTWAVLGVLVDFGALSAAPGSAVLVLLPVLGAIMVASIVVRVRRYPHQARTEQLQVKWFLAATAGWLLYPIVALLGLSDGWFVAADAISTSLFPIAIMIAITRYRLYEIDRLISRTVAYTLVLLVLAGVGAGALAILSSLLPNQDQVAVVAATLGVIALVDPLRRRVIDLVDRRFNRTRYVAQQVVEAFGREVQDQAELGAVQARLHDVISRTIAPTTVGVWLPVTQAAREAAR